MAFSFGSFCLDPVRREFSRRGNLVEAPPQVFDLIEYLIQNRERVVSKDELVAKIWAGRAVSDSAVTTRINAARTVLDDSGQKQRFIKTIPRKGFRFVGAVSEIGATTDAALYGASNGREPELPLPDRPSVAVLPFVNMSEDPSQQYFAEGMAAEIITALSRCHWLFVIARNSSFTYRSNVTDIHSVGRELGVRYVLVGGVRRALHRIRFTGQLIEADTGLQVWANTFEGDMGDLFELQDQMTEAVVAALEPSLELAEVGRLKNKPATNLDAYDLLLRAHQLEYEFTEESLAAALVLLDEAVRIDPNYASAMAFAAHCHGDRANFGWTTSPEADARLGLNLAWRAVELAKDDSVVLWRAAFAVFHLQNDPARAKSLADRSLELNPNSAIALAKAGRIETALGNTRKAIDHLVRAARLSPRDPRGWYIDATLAFAYYREKNYQEAIRNAKRAMNQNPNYTWSYRILAASQVMAGRTEEAQQVARDLLRIEPGLTLTKLKSRLHFREAEDFNEYAGALKVAGVPE